jgi:hypothetical protein
METQNSKQYVIIGGAHKAGTTSLYTYLSWHPDVCASAIKETHFFSQGIKRHEHIATQSNYEDFFKHCHEKKINLESSPEYLYGRESCAHLIKDTLPNVKLIFILRNPVEKIFSSYKHRKKKLLIPADTIFDSYASEFYHFNSIDDIPTDELNPGYELIEGCYANYLKAWFDVFGNDKIRVLFFDNLANSPHSVLVETCKFLGLDDNHFFGKDFEIENQSVSYRSKLLQSLAVKAFVTIETIIRKNYWLKKMLRNIYYAANAKKSDESMSSQTSEMLNAIYTVHNKELAALLRSYGYADLPTWLTFIK